MAAADGAQLGIGKVIVLVGLPGSGKSSVGRALARRVGVAWVDSDQAIEMHLGHAIREYFESQGEAAFRDLEERFIDELSRGAGVLSTGGGAVLREVNRRRLRERGTVIYLRSAPEQLFRRVRHDTKRPLLQVADPLERLKALHAERDPLYREAAHFVVDTHGLSMPMLVNRIMMQLELGGQLNGAANELPPEPPHGAA